MKIAYYIISCWSIFTSVTLSSQSLQIKASGLYNKTIQEKGINNMPGSYLGGFDPKYDYQIGILSQYPIYKSFILGGEIGYLTKGHVAHNFTTKAVLYEVNYNYLYIKPSLGYRWHGLTLSAGLFFNFLRNQDSTKTKTPRGTISKTDIAYSFELSYNYKSFGLSVSTNESLRPMQEITVLETLIRIIIIGMLSVCLTKFIYLNKIQVIHSRFTPLSIKALL